MGAPEDMMAHCAGYAHSITGEAIMRENQATDTADLLAAATRILGPVEMIDDHSWPHGEARVLEVKDRDGQLWIAKAVSQRHTYEREIHAMLTWAPALADAAPALRWHDDQASIMIMTRLPGHPVAGTQAETDPAVHRRAGQLIRLLHEASPAKPDSDLGRVLAEKLERWVARGQDLLSADEVEFARTETRKLAIAGPLPTVPCHLDNEPRNWLIDEAGSVGLIDFGHSRYDVWIRDMNRLYSGVWDKRPDLRDAYFDGYGRTPTEGDLLVLRSYSAYAGLSTIVWGHEHGDVKFSEEGHQTLLRMRAGEMFGSPGP